MPNNIIPYESQVSDVTALPNTRATPADMGAGIGQAIAGVGSSLGQLSDTLRAHQDREQGLDAELALAKTRQDMTQQLIQMENSPAAGTAGFTDHFNQTFDDYTAKAGNGLPANDKVQKAWQVGIANLRSELSDRAMQSQASQGAQLSVQKAQDGLSTYVNTIATDPTQYDTASAAAGKMIDGLALPPLESGKLKDGFTNTAITARFDALFRAAKTPAAIQGVVNDLENGDWKDKMGVQQFHALLTFAHSEQNSVQKLVNEQASAGVSSLEDRIKGGAAIDPAEMASVGDQVKQSNNPILLDKWARLQVQNDTTQRVKGLSTPALQGYVTTNKAGLVNEPMNAMPNTPTGRAQDGFAYLKSKYGLNDVQAMGVLANVGRETGFQPRPGDGGTSDGYFQWHRGTDFDRLTPAQAAGATGTDIRKAIDFAMSEPQGMAYLKLAQQGELRSPQEAARAWMDVFEKPQNPERDQPVNEQWAQRLTQAINGGRPLTSAGPQGAGPSYPSEADWLRAKSADEVLKRRDALVSQGDQMTAAQEAGLFQLGPLNNAGDFQARAQQSQTAQGFLDAKTNKPFTPPEVAAFDQVMQSGSIEQKQTLLQNVASMGSAAPAAFKQIGEKQPVFEHIGGLSNVSPTVAQDVLRGVQAIQDNPDIKAGLSAKGTGPGPGGTASVFNSMVGDSLAGMPKDAYAARQAADALYVQRSGPGAPWNADTYAQSVRDVLGGKPGDSAGGVANINGQPTALPPGVNGNDFQTMLHSLQPQDLLDHSIGGGPPKTMQGQELSPENIASEGKFKTIGSGIYNVYLADGKPALGTGPNGFYAFRIDAPGVQAILQRQAQQPASPSSASGVVSRVTNSLPNGPSGFDMIKSLLPDNFFRIPSANEVGHALSGGTQMGSEDNK